MKSIYDYNINIIDSDEIIHLADFKGKKMLLVNVASRCGYTPQYSELQELYEKYQEKLMVIGFPCNQFLRQESGSEYLIKRFCSVNFGVTFPMTTKIKVKGKEQHPIYEWLTKKELNGVSNNKVSWNFNKFLIDEQGNLLEYFKSTVKPLSKKITNHLNE